MNRSEQESINNLRNNLHTVGIQMVGQDERTLLVGYTLDRNTWHVYVKDGEIHRLISDGVTPRIISHKSADAWNAEDLLPDKRVYPEQTDIKFAEIVERSGIQIPFTTFNEDSYEEVQKSESNGLYFHSKIREDLS
ncbi:hypothetical protein ABT282_08585 [Streptomyces sp. NPDC000927]|uniref:hypothetical protein n=1 Tax=Streptomyces sp. NPDC000927 TaxID=3154371 RepID=UPI00332974C2